MQITLKKINVCEKPLHPSATKEEYIPGTGGVAGKSIPVDYTITGTLLYPLDVGGKILVRRTARNGVKVAGAFISSFITKIEGDKVFTENSVYQILELK